MKKIYLDNNATTPLDPEVLEEMLPYLKEEFGNPSSIHLFGRNARKAVDEARDRVASLLNCEASEIVFTGSGTEADNMAIKGVADATEKKHIITSLIEHHAILNACVYLEKKGYRITYVSVDRHGIVNVNQVKDAINEDTFLISIMHANNETGVIQPVEEIGRIAREKEIYFHTDAVQTTGKEKIDMRKVNIDLLSLSAHKIYGPKGTGALYIRKGTKMEAIIHGGHHEYNRRAGTENVAGIAGLGKATEIAGKEMEKESKTIRRLRDRLYDKVSKDVENVYLNGHPEKRTAGTLNLSFEFVEGEATILNLDLKGIGVSSGSACTSGTLTPSHVLTAMGVPALLAQSAIRFSLGKFNTQEEIDYTAEVIPEIIGKLRDISPLYKKKK